MGAGIERFATEIRSLQRTDVREAEEYFARGQTGSSAMPHKRNPITCERLTGMARLLRGYMMSAFENVALWHDRDISHSSVERVICPDAFHIAHYMLLKMTSVIENLLVYPERMLENMNNTKGLLFSQTVLGCLLKAGLERQQAYKSVQHAAMRVWGGEAEDFQSALLEEEMVKANVSPEVIAQAFSLDPYTRHIDTIFERANIKG
jgi:adenylosuccinate lyase